MLPYMAYMDPMGYVIIIYKIPFININQTWIYVIIIYKSIRMVPPSYKLVYKPH